LFAQTAAHTEPSWIQLFDGESLAGWKAESNANWRVEGAAIAVSEGEPGLLRTTSQFDAFELTLEFKSGPETNSGVFLLTSPRPTDPSIDCYEVNIVNPDRHEFATGAVVARARSQFSPELNDDEWHEFRIKVVGNRLRVETDGHESVDFEIERPLGRGFIGLQFREGPVAFRNVQLRPLELVETISSDALEKFWRIPEDSTCQIELVDDAIEPQLQLRGGPGYLESRESFADFVLQARCRLLTKDSNSGIFFRCIPGERLNGYECQLDNQVEPETNDQPLDFGTGGIYRRQKAQRIIARNPDWFDVTIVAVGPHVSTWVNGVQVADWNDQRRSDPNPRTGLRLEAGTIQLQGHDARTQLEVQRLSVRELTGRKR
jgi:hypothetical protein